MRVVSDGVLSRLWTVSATALLIGCMALVATGCGGGAGGGSPPGLLSSPTSDAVLETTPPALVPSTLVVGTPLSIDSGASGDPVSVRVALSANGEGFAVWQARRPEDEPVLPSRLWVNRYRATTAAWGTPLEIATEVMVNQVVDLAVDAAGNAVIAWYESAANPNEVGTVKAVRFDAGTGAWATPVTLNSNAGGPRVAIGASGAVLAVYIARVPSLPACANSCVMGRFFDPASGTWLPEALIEQNHTGNSVSFQPQAMLDASGNALVAFSTGNGPNFEEHALASNYHSTSTGGWRQLSPDDPGLLGAVPGSLGFHRNLQLALTTGGNFLAIWQIGIESAEIAMARFTTRTRTWSAKQTLVPGSPQRNVNLQRIGNDASGNAHLTWIEWDGMRDVLKAAQLDSASASCTAVQTIDRAVGGHVAEADLAVDPIGDAIAIWEQLEGAGSEAPSNIAINRFDRTTGAWERAVLVQAQTGIALMSRSPSASAAGGQALLGWIQLEGSANRVKALRQPLANPPGQ